MTQEEKDEIKKLVLEEIESIQKTIVELEELTKPDPQQDANDWFTSKESTISKDINEKALVKNRIKFTQLHQTLIRIDSPQFGICIQCKQPIPFVRIEAMPETERCVQCASL